MNTLTVSEDELGVEERAALLRAARLHLEHMQEELKQLNELPMIYAHAPIAATQVEVANLARGIAWLWRQTIKKK